MELRETGVIADAALPVAEFRAHLRLGAGFADEASGDPLLAGYLRAAMAAIEARTGKALLQRPFLLVLTRWRWPDSQALPVAPVAQVSDVVLRDGAGDTASMATDQWRLVVDAHRPRLAAARLVFPPIPEGGQAEIAFVAGLAEAWADLPADLRQAVLLLAAQLHEGRLGAAVLPASVEALLARWRLIRVGGAR